MMKILKLAIALLLASSSPAQAACQQSWVCDGNGMNCGYRDICSSTLDLPSTNVAPLPALPPVTLKPLPSVSLPPLGTSGCQYLQVNGQWQNVCK
jgi:hypothetical protein